jgi:hypothetical protein
MPDCRFCGMASPQTTSNVPLQDADIKFVLRPTSTKKHDAVVHLELFSISWPPKPKEPRMRRWQMAWLN